MMITMIMMIVLLSREDVRTANVIACDADGVDCLVLEREYVLTHTCISSAAVTSQTT